MHGHLRATTARRIPRVAIHPVLGDVDVKTAQVDRAKLIQDVIDLMKFEELISRSAIFDHLIEAFQNPTIHQCCCSGGFRPTLSTLRERRYRKIVKIAM